MAVILNNEPQGWVISCSKDDINTLSLQLSQVQQYADNLRAVQHEHRNLISTIAGLLFLKRYNQALELIPTAVGKSPEGDRFYCTQFQTTTWPGC